MAKKNSVEENRKTFEDKTFKSWYVDEDGKVKVGESLVKIMKGDCETLEVKETYYGNPSNTWRIVQTADDKLHLLKSAKELK
jgi:hypothetical protein